MLIDIALFLPLLPFINYFRDHYRYFDLYWLVPSLLISLAFHVLLVYRFGGTPGKLLLDTRITMVDGRRVTLTAACIRYFVEFFFTTAVACGIALAALKLSDTQYLAIGRSGRYHVIETLTPSWYHIVSILGQIWVWSEVVTMLFNSKRRAIHDYMAGTVVILRDLTTHSSGPPGLYSFDPSRRAGGR